MDVYIYIYIYIYRVWGHRDGAGGHPVEPCVDRDHARRRLERDAEHPEGRAARDAKRGGWAD